MYFERSKGLIPLWMDKLSRKKVRKMTMEQALKENKMRMRKHYEDLKKQELKEQRKTKVVVMITSMLIIGLVIYYMISVSKMSSKAIENCMKDHSKTYCVERLG